MEAFFSCYPPPSDCEWRAAVRELAQEYNRLRKTDYVRETCYQPAGVAIPEVRLVATSGRAMVVERKTIVWPATYLASPHRQWHVFAEHLCDALGSLSTEPRTVVIRSGYLNGLSKPECRRVAQAIVDSILAGEMRGRVPCGAQSQMPWSTFVGVLSAPQGTKVEVLDDEAGDVPWDDLDSLLRIRQQQITGYQERLGRCLTNVERSFAPFADHLRVLLLQFVGESSALLEETDLAQIIKDAENASFVDEVWIASKEWISEDEFRILWVPFCSRSAPNPALQPTGSARG